jgi:hypothetical protein
VVSRVGPISVVVMSVSEVLAPSQTMHEKNGNAITKTKNVAIVAPQRSNSLDYLNFEEKRRLIASSLSLSDFLAAGNNTTKELKDAVVVGECCAHLEQRMRSGDHRGLSFALSTKFACRVEVLFHSSKLEPGDAGCEITTLAFCLHVFVFPDTFRSFFIFNPEYLVDGD